MHTNQIKHSPHGMTPSSVKMHKAVNSSLSSTSTNSHCNSVVKSASYKSLHPVTNSVRKESVNAVKVSKCLQKHSTFDSKSSSPDQYVAKGPTTRKEELQNELKNKISAYTIPLLASASNTKKFKNGPAKVKQSIYCPSKAMREQYLIDTSNPISAEQIIANTGRAAKKINENDAKFSTTCKENGKKLDTFGQAGAAVADEARLKFLDRPGITGSGKLIRENTNNKKTNEISTFNNSSKGLINVVRPMQITASGQNNNNPAIQYNKVTTVTTLNTLANQHKPPSLHNSSHEVKKLSLSLSSFHTKEFEEYFFINCIY